MQTEVLKSSVTVASQSWLLIQEVTAQGLLTSQNELQRVECDSINKSDRQTVFFNTIKCNYA